MKVQLKLSEWLMFLFLAVNCCIAIGAEENADIEKKYRHLKQDYLALIKQDLIKELKSKLFIDSTTAPFEVNMRFSFAVNGLIIDSEIKTYPDTELNRRGIQRSLSLLDTFKHAQEYYDNFGKREIELNFTVAERCDRIIQIDGRINGSPIKNKIEFCQKVRGNYLIHYPYGNRHEFKIPMSAEDNVAFWQQLNDELDDVFRCSKFCYDNMVRRSKNTNYLTIMSFGDTYLVCESAMMSKTLDTVKAPLKSSIR